VDYPIWNLAFGGGVLIGIVAITHVLVSHFAIGGGFAIAFIETLAVRRGNLALRALAKRSSLMLILVSTVFGAISGVGIWVTIGLVQPAATSALIHTYVWGWATEWGFFILEVATALHYYATWEKVRPRTHLVIIWLYFFAAYMSLVVIQGILAFMLTPGAWLEDHSFWSGFFNPSYAPGLVLRTGICLFLAGAYLTLAALREPDLAARARMVRLLAIFQVVGVLLAYGGYRWWEHALPGSVRAIFLGAKALLPALASTRHLVLWALAFYLLLAYAGYRWWEHALPGSVRAIFLGPKAILPALASTRHLLLWALAFYLLLVFFALAVPRLHRWPSAVAALLAAFVFFGGYERLREGARKPFVIRDYMFSNGVLVSEIPDLNQRGILAKAVWAARGSDASAEAKGRAVFRAQCASCHTVDGYLSIRKLVAPVDPDMLRGILATMREEGKEYSSAGYVHQGHVATEKLDYPLMPPLVGTEEEVDALAGYLLSLKPSHVAEVSHAR
jgi:cytochrome d ubiquinol oxidase subunit I